jgi:hypothetical protein
MKASLPVVLLFDCNSADRGPTSLITERLEDAPEAIIEGLVRGIACPIPNEEASATHLSVKCPLACARSGSPLVILPRVENYPSWISGKSPCHSRGNTCGPVAGL